MNKLKGLIAACSAVIMTLPILCYARTPAPIVHMSLRDAVFLALRYNPDVLGAQFQVVLQKYQVLVEKYAFDFQYTFTAGVGYTHTRQDGISSTSRSYTATPGMSVQTYNGGKFTAALANNYDGSSYNPQLTLGFTQPLIQGSSRAVVMAPLFNAIDSEYISHLTLQQSVVENITNVINNYRNYIAAKENLLILKQSVARSSQTVKQTRLQIKAGVLARMDLLQAQQNVSQNQLSLIQQENSLTQARQQLLTSIGINPNLPIVIDDQLTIPDFKIPDLKKSIAIALKNDPTYQSDLIQERIAARNLLVAKDNLRWQLNANVQTTFGSGGDPSNTGLNSLFNNQDNSQSVNLTLNIPINQVPLQQQVVAAKIALDQQRIDTQTQKRQVISNVINAIQAIKSAKQGIKVAIENQKFAKLNLENSYKKFKYGRITMFELTQQQDQLTSANISVLQAKIDYVTAITAYQQVLQTTLKVWGIKLRY